MSHDAKSFKWHSNWLLKLIIMVTAAIYFKSIDSALIEVYTVDEMVSTHFHLKTDSGHHKVNLHTQCSNAYVIAMVQNSIYY